VPTSVIFPPMSTAAQAQIREATAADAALLAAFAAAVFRHTYARSATPVDLEAYIARYLHPQAQATEIVAGDWRTLLAEIDGTLVGYAQLRRGAAPACVRGAVDHPATAREIRRFYVAPEWHGRGIARELMAECLRTPPPNTPIWLGVFSGNPRAISFYTKAGFRIVGEMTFLMGSDVQRDHVMQITDSEPLTGAGESVRAVS
jgi:diamine N-acetyltransferase